MLPLTSLVPYARNARTHSAEQIEQIAASIGEFGFTGDAVYEPFSGSGTTIIAAEITSRVCHAIELNPAYVDVAIRRWQNFTGQRAVHAVTGAPFPD